MEEEKGVTPAGKTGKYIKKTLKVFLYVFLGIIGLNLLLYILLSIPAVQKQVVDFAISKIKPIVNTEITIDQVRISLFNHVNIKGVYIEDQSQDTLLYAGELDVKLNVFGLLRNKLTINHIELNNVVANVTQKNSDAPFNFQFLIDAFTSDTEQDTTKSSLIISIEDINIKSSRISYNVFSEPETPGVFNASHIKIDNFNTRLSLKSIDVTKLNVAIKTLSFNEKSGFILKDAEAEIRSKGMSIWADKFRLSLPSSELSMDSLMLNMFNKQFQATGNMDLSPRDVMAFMPDLGNLDNNVNLKTRIMGKLPAIDVQYINANYGDEMNLEANASISDYENYDKSSIYLNISKFKASKKAITQFARIADSTFVMPEVLSVVDYIRLNGSVNGYLENMNIKAEAWTEQGTLELNGHASVKDTTFENFTANVNLRTLNFNLAPFVGYETGIGRLSAHANVDLTSVNSNITAKAIGTVESIGLDTMMMQDIHFRANYDPVNIDGWIQGATPLGDVLAEAHIKQTGMQEINVNAVIRDLKVDYFYEDSLLHNPRLSMNLVADLKGSTIDNMQGTAVIDSLIFWGDDFKYQPGRLKLESALDNNENRYIQFESNILDFNITGEYSFLTLTDEVFNMMNAYLPGFFEKNNRLKDNKNNFTIDITVYDTEELGRILHLPANLMQPVEIHGTVNTAENNIWFDANIPYLKYGDMDIKKIKVGISADDSVMSMKATTYIPFESLDIDFGLNAVLRSDTIDATFDFQSDTSRINLNGELKALANFTKDNKDNLVSYVKFDNSPINVGKLNLSFLPAEILNEGNRTSISNFGFNIGRGRMFSKYFGADGVISDQDTDTLTVSFFNARLAEIFEAFDVNNVKATINGDIELVSLLNSPEFYTDNLNIADIIIFSDTLGTMSIKSRWEERVGAIGLDAWLTNGVDKSTVGGMIFPQKDSLNLNINFDRFSLSWIQPFVPDMLMRMDGSLSSGIKLTGKISAPEADGWIGFNDVYAGIDFTNVTYHISDTISVLPDRIGFENLTIEDNNGNKAIASASITHHNFTDPHFEVNMDLKNFLMLNTETRTDSLFYGKLLASGNVKLKGNMEDIDINMNIRNERGSKIFITISEVSEAAEYQSIVYINVPVQDSIAAHSPSIPSSESLPLHLAMDLAVSPEITLGVLMNSSNPIDMQMRGSGLINFTYDMHSELMRAYGDYSISDGYVKVRPQNIKTLEFKIQDGSKVRLNGDPMQASFDITAYYRVNASLATLSDGFSTSKIPVNCVLKIKGNMNRMDLTYDINLPEASDDIQAQVRSLISTDEQRIRQFAYLIVTGAFYSNSMSVGGSNMLTSIASSTLSGGLDALFGSVLGSNWQIGTDISSNDGTFEDVNVSVNISTKFLDDRLKLNTNLGYRNDQSVNDESTFVGDFDLQYELTKTLDLKVYNKTNDRFYKTAPTTQGIGLVYTKEAKKIKDLFRFFSRKRKEEDN